MTTASNSNSNSQLQETPTSIPTPGAFELELELAFLGVGTWCWCCATLALLLAFVTGCSKEPPKPAAREVVAYVAQDEEFARPLLEAYERESGVTVKTVYDGEAAKSTVLATRLREERDRPQADVWWNHEPVLTRMIEKEGLLTAYESPSARDVPPGWVDADRQFVSFAVRARVILANTHLVPERDTPRSIWDLVKPQWKGKVGIAKPLYGTTLTQCACLFEALGEEKAKEWLRALKANEARVLLGNSTVRDQVASGELALGLTDTDDANGAVVDGKPVRVVFPDADGIGTVLLPDTLALVKGAPHEAEAKKLIDWLLRPEVESRLAASRSAQMPVRASAKVPSGFTGLGSIRAMQVDFDKASARLPEVFRFLEEEFLR